MPQFEFRLRFNLPDAYRIDSDAEVLELVGSPSQPRLYLQSGVRGSPIKDHPRAAVRGGPFESEQQARDAAEAAKLSLLYWAIEGRSGIDFGDGKQHSGFTDYGLRWLEEQRGVPIRNDIHGIDVFEPQDGLRFVHMSMAGVVGKYPPTLATTFQREYERGRQLTEKQILAGEIYASSFFDVGRRSRFITLVTAVEALLEPVSRPQAAQDVVRELLSQLDQAAIDEATKASLRGGLDRLRRQSIRQAGRTLADQLLVGKRYRDMLAGDFFVWCYDLRSAIVHEGAPDVEIDIGQAVTVTDEFVSHLLLASMNAAGD